MTVRSRVDVDPVFEQQLNALRRLFASMAEAVFEGKQPTWMMPAALGWGGDLSDLVGMNKMFDRSKATEQFIAAISDPTNPGTTADLIAATTMIDWLSCMERAFRSRHTMPRNRALLHAANRMRGHGSEQGALITSCLEYLRRVVAAAKGETGETS